MKRFLFAASIGLGITAYAPFAKATCFYSGNAAAFAACTQQEAYQQQQIALQQQQLRAQQEANEIARR